MFHSLTGLSPVAWLHAYGVSPKEPPMMISSLTLSGRPGSSRSAAARFVSGPSAQIVMALACSLTRSSIWLAALRLSRWRADFGK